ncbi:hypothetical protein SAMN04487907_101726 [Zunongwangia mangrovi]|uniref:GLPGLI family protein n=1 Tax=Zunongwangia mangrovi TaxID=1334022 RepID=A0A1I1E7C8_9FLAO|nr:hypothetical protein [Zunongwangia mangrovi]SFB80853.1 hypothetical protein SAMN04487907_101726 [Zunongwangia mangrovi]
MKQFYISIAFFLILCLNSFSQQYYDLPNNLKDSHRSIKEVFTVTNNDNGNLTIFIDDNTTFNAYIYNEEIELVSALQSDGLPKKYDRIIGYIQNENITTLFLQHKNDREFGAIQFDFNNKQTKEIEFDFKLKKEAYIEALSKDNRLYILTIEKNSSNLNIYTFDGIQKSKNTLELGYKYRIDDIEPKDLHEMLISYGGMSSSIEIEKIDNQAPVSIELASATNKLYETPEGFNLSLDKSIFETFVISVDLNDYTTEIRQFAKPKYNAIEGYHSNSFLLKDNIYQIVANSNELYFEAKNMTSNKVIKNIILTAEEEIDFKNTPIIQDKEGDLFAPHRELEKTSKFLRKIDNENIGVSVFQKDDKNIVTLGSHLELQAGGPMMMGMPGMGGMAGMGFAMQFNLYAGAYFSYTRGKSVRIQCLFDQNFKHLQGEIEDNVFDRIKKFTKHLKNNDTGENVFEWNDSVFYGYYNKDSEAYRIKKFKK